MEGSMFQRQKAGPCDMVFVPGLGNTAAGINVLGEKTDQFGFFSPSQPLYPAPSPIKAFGLWVCLVFPCSWVSISWAELLCGCSPNAL